MESQQIAAHTFPAQQFAQSFFREVPTDERYLQYSFQKFPPSCNIDSDTITFDLIKFDAANLYMLNQACLEVKCRILKANGEFPDKNKKVWIVNNALHSLFSIVRVILNDRPVTKQPDHYPYKAYIATLLTYDALSKNAQLAAQGFYSDISGHMGNTDEDYLVNVGSQERVKIFRKGHADDGDYKEEGFKFFGRLHLDFISASCGLPPGTKVRLELVKSPSSFVLMCQPNDNEKYQVKIDACNLYVPIAQVSAPVYSEISSIYAKKSVALHYRRTEVRPITIPKFKEEFNSDTLFSEEMPCRLILCFVEEKAKQGDYSKNPFNFQRSWQVIESANELSKEPKEEQLERQLNELKDLVLQMQQQLSSTQNQRRESRSRAQEQSSSFLGRFGFQNEERGSDTSDDPPSYTDGPDPPQPPAPKIRNVYIKNVEMTLNQLPLDMVLAFNGYTLLL
ncbi:MAG: hypothetical protein FJ333_02235 [Sphingomonadales bacterium]|nr:hypothetical protein [Sphingomonadales bacterium]